MFIFKYTYILVKYSWHIYCFKLIEHKGVNMKYLKLLCFLPIFYLVILGFMIADEQDSTVEEAIFQLEESFGSTFYKSLYSIDELRPYSIIQLNKTISSYENSWISPDDIVSKINNNDRKVLKNSLLEFLMTLESDIERNMILNKIKYWCISACQLELMINKMEIPKDEVLLYIIPKIPAAVNSNTGEIVSENSNNNTDYYYYTVINQLSKLNLKEQFKLYSDIFSEFSE